MKLEADFLHHPATGVLARVFAGHQLYFVGGCVRDAVLGRASGDLDLATDAHPDEMSDLAASRGVRIIPTGRDHGTMTFVIDGVSFQVTTFRQDIETDGRHARVAFSKSIEQDALRRDFTMNALYLSLSGSLLDPVGGIEDAQNGVVRFIGDPFARIREDFLRILRFFRFLAHYAHQDAGVDADGLAACAELADELVQVSPERVTAELLKLLSAKNPAIALGTMAQSGVLMRILAGADIGPVMRLLALESDRAAPSPLLRLACLGGDREGLRLSRKQSRTLGLLKNGVEDTMSPAELAYRFGQAHARSVVLLRASIFQSPIEEDTRAQIAKGAAARFPIQADDLMPQLTGKELGEALDLLENRWIASGFSMGKDALVASAMAKREPD